jgi:hypothetical protein
LVFLLVALGGGRVGGALGLLVASSLARFLGMALFIHGSLRVVVETGFSILVNSL